MNGLKATWFQLFQWFQPFQSFEKWKDCVAIRKSHECHSESEAKNLTCPATCEGEILGLSPRMQCYAVSRSSETAKTRGLSCAKRLKRLELLERLKPIEGFKIFK
jgi:hypothetical protein